MVDEEGMEGGGEDEDEDEDEAGDELKLRGAYAVYIGLLLSQQDSTR